MRKRMMIQFIAIAAFICCYNPIYSNVINESDEFIGCNDNVQISIAGDCTGISPSHFLEGNEGSGPYLIQIEGGHEGVALTATDDFSAIDWSSLIGGQGIKYKIIDGNSIDCWGTFDLEANVLPAVDLSPCAYIQGSTLSVSETLQPGATDTYTFEITDVCQSYEVVKTSGGLRIECDTDPSGWCIIDCGIEITNAGGTVISDLSGSGLSPGTYTVSVSADNPTFLGAYDLEINVTDCGVPCENWCESPPPSEFITLKELEEMLASSCMVEIDVFSTEVFETGDICTEGGILHVVKYGGQFESHGEMVTVNLMTQAYRSLPLDLYIPGPTAEPVTQACTGSGTINPIFEFPADIALNCDADFSPEGIAAAHGDGAGWPLLTDVHVDIPDSIITCIDTHIDVIIDTIVAPVEISPGVWSNVLTVRKDRRDTTICTKEPSGTITNPKYPLSSGLFCNIFSTYEDIELPGCGGGKKIVRYWKLTDWCTSQCYETKQTIEVTDVEAPTVVGIVQLEQSFEIEPVTCLADLSIAGPVFEDNCNDNPNVQLELVEKLSGIVIDPSSVPVGEYTATYIAQDGCGNLSEPVVIDITVTENQKPIAVCKDVVVSLTPDMEYVEDGVAKLYAPVFDRGSHDSGCGAITTMEVIRMEDFEAGEAVSCDPIIEERVIVPSGVDKFGVEIPEVTGLIPVFGEYVKFCCADVGLDRQVVLRVYDNQGNSNDCMVNVEVQDKLSGGISCPNYTISCFDFPDEPTDNLPTFFAGSCDDLDLELIDEEVNVDGCGAGTVLREWAATREGAIINTCIQLVTVESKGAFNPLDIKWPLHYTEDENVVAYNKENNPETDACTLLSDPTSIAMNGILTCSQLEDQELCRPTVPEGACGLIGISFEDEIVVFTDDACEKIIRRWTVLDWCVYVPNSEDEVEDNNDTAGDTFIACVDWCEEDECLGNYYFRYESVVEDGYYSFDQVIKIIDDVVPTVDCEATAASSSFDGTSCTGSISASAVGQDMGECPTMDLTWNIILKGADGSSIDIQSARSAVGETVEYNVDGIAEGNYTVCFTAIDACGNRSESCEIAVSISDTKAPTPICIQRLSTAVMQAGEPQVAIWAVDYNVKSEDNCTPIDELRYSFSEDSIVTSLTFTCADVTGFPVELQMWVWDNSDNRDFCFVEIRVEGDETCAEGRNLVANVAGYIQTEQGDMISNTEVALNSDHPEYPSMNTTQDDGNYAFMNNPMYQNYELTADKNDDYINGVSTLDLVLMNKHILGVDLLDSPYKIIAADINNSGTVSATDLVQLRKLILGLIVELPNNDSWRFVDANQTFANPYHPWPFTESIELINLEENMINNDFIGVKIGDVNGTVKPNSFKKTEVRSNKSLVLDVKDQYISKGELVELNFTSNSFENIEGFQFTLEHESMEVINANSENIVFDNTNIGKFDGRTTLSYHNTGEAITNKELFTIQVKALTDAHLSDLVKISSRITPAESYFNNDTAIADVEIHFENEVQSLSTEIILHQNTPNPFSNRTTIAFDIPIAQVVTIQVHDLSGKQVYNLEQAFNAGRNEISLDKDVLKSSGVYYYTLISDKSTDTKSMILLE